MGQSTQASLLLQKQLKDLSRNPVDGFSAVYADGRVCISILHAPGDDPNGYELASERWTPVHTVFSRLLDLVLFA
ncbi:hypothetical protein C5167_000200 [Papaver somniferum]|uniref:UBC core domain-containing protein n=1 Tax=Papaver somniferum TaxID=3469 RepID=A0A4Y7KVS0_PAPSO|nr:hypothetical protein C5167_000200 [Papaver somniferum]